jgi:Flp pilus assembly protein TadD
MRGRRRTATLLVALGVLGGWNQAVSQDDAEREQRREQLRRSRVLLAEAREQIDSGAYDSAEAKLRTVLETDVANADAHYLLGWTLLARGDTTAAATIVEQGVERAPFSTRLKLLLARLQIDAGRAEEAGALLDGVLKIRPRDGEVLYVRGLAHLAMGDSLGALSAWRTSLAVAVGGPEP